MVLQNTNKKNCMNGTKCLSIKNSIHFFNNIFTFCQVLSTICRESLRIKHNVKFCNYIFDLLNICAALCEKFSLMRVRKMSSQISMCSFWLNWIFAKLRLSWTEKYHKSGKCRPCKAHMGWRTCIKPPFHKARLNYIKYTCAIQDLEMCQNILCQY